MKKGLNAEILSVAARFRPESMEDQTRERLSLFIEDIREMGVKTHLVGKEHLRKNILRQFVDSIMLLNLFEKEYEGSGAIADIGSGAGFPGMVWKILAPELEITLMEKKRKLASFLAREAKRLKLDDIDIFEGRAEEAGKGYYRAVVSKAAGKLERMLPVADRLLGEGGVYLTVKGTGYGSGERVEGRGRMKLSRSVEMGKNRGRAVIFRKT